ncbi:hypothetical protein [Ralstonia solanacearum]|uniref:hypothetical protein n=1 Tax=Ralstonia solanacearum TaxID=305 RepID=UPI001300D9AE|nr:hypothetical protein [Ralstonia solanacearum]
MTIIFNNKSDVSIQAGPKDYELKNGIWTPGYPFATMIPEGSELSPKTGAWRTESQGFIVGTEGWANYTLGDSSTLVRIAWSSPAVGSPNCYAWIDGLQAEKYKVEYQCCSEHNCTCRFELRKA